MIRRGDMGPRVRELQRALVAAGYRIRVDGVMGPQTDRTLRAWQRGHALAPDGIAGPVTWAALCPPPAVAVESVGVWCGAASLAHPERDVDAALALRVDELHVVVNDHSGRRLAARYGLRDHRAIAELARRAQDAGIAVHLTSWVMPHAIYIAGMSDLASLARDIGAESVLLDAEEPWTLAYDALDRRVAAELVGEHLVGLRVGVTGIGYAGRDMLGPLCGAADYVVPQCYSTVTSQIPPERVGQLAARWRSVFGGGGDRDVAAGLAAYGQHGIRDHTAASAIASALRSVRDAGCRRVIYWSLGHARRSRAVARAIAAVREDG